MPFVPDTFVPSQITVSPGKLVPGDDAMNALRTLNITATGSQVRLSLAPDPSVRMAGRADVRYVWNRVVNGQLVTSEGNFATDPLLDADMDLYNQPIYVGIDKDLNGKLDDFFGFSSEYMFEIKVLPLIMDTAGLFHVRDRRTASDLQVPGVIEPSYYWLAEGEEVEVGGTFSFQLTTGDEKTVPGSQMIAYMLIDDTSNQTAVAGRGFQFSYRFDQARSNHEFHIRYYVDSNNNLAWDQTESAFDSLSFKCVPLKMINLTFQFSTSITVAERGIVVDALEFAAAELMRRDGNMDHRALVQFVGNSVCAFTPDGTRKDSVTYMGKANPDEESDLVPHWNIADFVFVKEVLAMQPDNTTQSVRGVTTTGRRKTSVIKWDSDKGRLGVAMIHELAHALGIEHPLLGSANYDNRLMSRTGTGTQTTEEEAAAFEGMNP